MPAFEYKAKSKDKRLRSGSLTAASKAEAKALLRMRGLRSIEIRLPKATKLFEGETPVIGEILFKDEKGNFQFNLGEQLPTSKDVIVFTKQLATMVGSGVPLIQSLGILEKQQSSRGFRRTLKLAREAVEGGESFSAALTKFPKIFDPLYTAMAAAGEASGNLDVIFKKLVSYIEKADKIKNQIKSAMAYPIVVLVVAISVVTGLLAFVVPIFAQQFQETGRALPWLTQQVIDFSNFFRDYWYLIFGSIFLALIGFRYWKKTPKGEKSFDALILKFPVIGDLLRKIAVGRFCSTMASMLSSGVNLLEALSICATSAGNKTIELFILNVKVSLEKGSTFSAPLSEGTLFPSMVVSMVAVGESTGKLDEMLLKVSDFYEEEVDNSVKAMLSMIEPIMIVVIGSIIALVVVAMYLPVFEMAGGIE